MILELSNIGYMSFTLLDDDPYIIVIGKSKGMSIGYFYSYPNLALSYITYIE